MKMTNKIDAEAENNKNKRKINRLSFDKQRCFIYNIRKRLYSNASATNRPRRRRDFSRRTEYKEVRTAAVPGTARGAGFSVTDGEGARE
jgi:hypothetical protein